MSAIFISHRSTDNAVAFEVKEWLEAQGHRSVFLDFDPVDGIPAGRDWEQEVYQQLQTCRAVVALCSREYQDSHWCFTELAFARAAGKPVLPIKIDDGPFHPLVADRQIIDITADKAEGHERLLRGLLKAGLDPTDSFDWDGHRSPYPGLLAFGEDDAAVFFGREGEVTEGLGLLNRMRRLDVRRMAAVMGPSGSGKSSLVRAGFVPRLRKDPDRWLVIDPFRPGNDPYRELANVLSRAFTSSGTPRSREDLLRLLAKDGDPDGGTELSPLVHLTAELLLDANRPEAKALLVIDQLEELLGFEPGHQSNRFLTMLRGAVTASNSRLVVVATMRSDFLSELYGNPGLSGLGYESLTVGPLSSDGVIQVIRKPAEMAGFTLETGLAEVLAADSNTDGGLPLMAYALGELYERFGQRGHVSIEDYREGFGGLHGAIARVAEEIVDSQRLSERQLDDLRVAFLAMVRWSEDGRWSSQPVRWSDLPRSVHPVLERFVKDRLLVSRHDGHNAETRALQVAHESLFRSWDRLAGWVTESAAMLRLRHDLQLASATWRDNSRDPSYLWAETRLARATDLVDRDPVPLRPGDREFLDASQRDQRAKRNRQARRRRRWLGILSVITAIAVVFALQARNESARANAEANEATALGLITAARSIQDDNPALALALAHEASETAPESIEEVTSALDDARTAFAARSWQPIRDPIEAHRGTALGVAFSPDGTMLASAGADQTVRLWNPGTGQAIGQPLTGHEGANAGLKFSPDGSMLASASADGTVRLWDPATHEPKGQPLTGHDGPVYRAVFSPDSATLASAGNDGTIRLWDPATGAPKGEPLTGHDGAVYGVAFHPDGDVLASAGDDGTVRLWNVNTGEPIGTPLGDGGLVAMVEFSPDGTVLASTGADGKVRLWNPTTGQPLGQPLTDPNGAGIAIDLAFNSDGTILAASNFDGTVRLWDMASHAMTALTGHNGATVGVAFKPGEPVLASAGADGTIRLWDLTPGEATEHQLTGHNGAVAALAFSSDGAILASASRDGTARLWNPATGVASGRPLTGHAGGVTALAFNPDDTVLATAGDDGTVRLWDPATGTPRQEASSGHRSGISALAFSPDGAVLASSSFDGTIRLRDPDTGAPVAAPLIGHSGPITEVAFSPDGDTLVSASLDGTVRRWNPTTGAPIGEPLAIRALLVTALAVSPDGTMVATAGSDGTIALWDPNSGELIGEPLSGHSGPALEVAFNHDGRTLASAGSDNTVRLWDPSTGEPIGAPLTGSYGAVGDVAFHPNGDVFATAGDDHTVRLWNINRLFNDTRDPCTLTEPYVRATQVRDPLPTGRTPRSCDYQ